MTISHCKTQRERAANCLQLLAVQGHDFTAVVLANMSGITLHWAIRLCHAAVRRGELELVRPALRDGTRAIFRGPVRARESRR